MNELEQLLGKYRNIKPPQDSIRRAVVEVIQNTLGIKIEKKNVKVNRGKIYIDANSHVKNMILLEKEKVISKLESAIGSKSKIDIR